MEVRFKDALTVILIKWPKNKYTGTYIYIQRLPVSSLEKFFLSNFFYTNNSQKTKDDVLECGHIVYL